MSDDHECSGCYLWENNIGSACSKKIQTDKITCPCMTCIVKSMCDDGQACEEYMRIYNIEYIDEEP